MSSGVSRCAYPLRISGVTQEKDTKDMKVMGFRMLPKKRKRKRKKRKKVWGQKINQSVMATPLSPSFIIIIIFPFYFPSLQNLRSRGCVWPGL